MRQGNEINQPPILNQIGTAESKIQGSEKSESFYTEEDFKEFEDMGFEEALPLFLDKEVKKLLGEQADDPAKIEAVKFQTLDFFRNTDNYVRSSEIVNYANNKVLTEGTANVNLEFLHEANKILKSTKKHFDEESSERIGGVPLREIYLNILRLRDYLEGYQFPQTTEEELKSLITRKNKRENPGSAFNTQT